MKSMKQGLILRNVALSFLIIFAFLLTFLQKISVYSLDIEALSVDPTIANWYDYPTPISLDSLDQFGAAVEFIGDLDRDGFEDAAITARLDDDGGLNRGAVYILFLNGDYSIKSVQKISDTQGNFTANIDNIDIFGGDIVNLGDVDGDDITDMAVSAYWDDDGGSNAGAVYILFLNIDGTVKDFSKLSSTTQTQLSIQSGSRFGFGLDVLQDTNGDQIPELLVGAPDHDGNTSNSGAVYKVSFDNTGTVTSSETITDTDTLLVATNPLLKNFGSSVAGIGDIDNDGVEDIAIGSDSIFSSAAGFQTGTTHVVLLNSNFTVKSIVNYNDGTPQLTSILADNNEFGKNIDGLGDLDGNGVEDIIVGTPRTFTPSGVIGKGILFILYLNTDGTLSSMEMIQPETTQYNINRSEEDGLGNGLSFKPSGNGGGVLLAGLPNFSNTRGGYTVFEINDRSNQSPILSVDQSEVIIEENTINLPVVVTAQDNDSNTFNGGTGYSFSLTGDDAGLFAITQLGVISFNEKPDFENPSDSNNDNVYDFTIELSDDGIPVQTVAQDIQVTVTDNIDEDGDGLLDVDEIAVPNDGDANNDGVLDSIQADVASLFVNDGVYVSLDGNGCSFLNAQEFTPAVVDETHDYITDFIQFTADCTTLDIDVLLYSNNGDLKLRKYLNDDGYVDIDTAISEVVIDSQNVLKFEYQIIDGDLLDSGPEGDNQIIDPIGFGIAIDPQDTVDDGNGDRSILIRTGGF